MTQLVGTVIVGGSSTVTVAVDGAPDDTPADPVPIRNWTGRTLLVGQRVRVEFTDDGGVAVTGAISQPPQPWNPTYTNLTIGSGGEVVTAWAPQTDGLIWARFQFVLGAGSAVGTQPRISLPVPAASTYLNATSIIGSCMMVGPSGVRYPGTVSWGTNNNMVPAAINTAGTYATFALLSATVPFTWATGHALECEVSYEPA